VIQKLSGQSCLAAAVLLLLCACTTQPYQKDETLPASNPAVQPPSALVTPAPLKQAATTSPQDHSTTPAAPQSNQFFGLPSYDLGQEVQVGDYVIQADPLALEQGRLTLKVKLVNNSAAPIDLAWALQLRDEKGGLVQGKIGAGDQAAASELAAQQSLEDVWVFGLPDNYAAALKNYHLVFAPRGWSGPVIVFRLAEPGKEPLP
jgi:hypothetical protein